MIGAQRGIAFLFVMSAICVVGCTGCALLKGDEEDERYQRAEMLEQKVEELYKSGRYVEAIPLAQEALELWETALDPDDRNVAGALNNVAELYRMTGAYTKAEPLYQRALAIEEKALGADDPNLATALNNLAELYRMTGVYAKAEPLYQRALAINEKALGAKHPNLSIPLNNLGLLYQDIGAYAKAEPLYRRALAIDEKAFGAEHPNLAISLNNLGLLYQDIGAYAKAEPLYQRALTIQEKALGPEHATVATVLDNLAGLYDLKGAYTKAEAFFRRSLAIREKALGPQHADVARSLNNLALLYDHIGAYGKAEPLYQRALMIWQNALGPEHPTVATVLNNLAQLYYYIGAYAKAEPLYQKSLAISEKAFGSDHPVVASSLNNLAMLYQDMHVFAKAEPLYQRALVVWEKVLGPEHPNLATSLDNLGTLYRTTGAYAKAEPLYQRALAIREKSVGPQHPSVAGSLNNLADLYRASGAYGRAEPLLQRALAIHENALGLGHPHAALILSNLGFLAAAQHNYQSALAFIAQGLLVEDRQIQNIFTFATEQQKLQFLRTIEANYSIALSLIHQYLKDEPQAVRDGLHFVLRRKGVVFDAESRAREGRQGQLSETARREWEQLSALRGELAGLLLNKPDKLPLEYRERLAFLQQQIEKHERLLANESPVVATELEQRGITVEAAAKALPKQGALIEFAKIRDFDFAKGTEVAPRYLAFVLNPGGNVTLVDLGAASLLETRINRTLEDIRVSMSTARRDHVHQSLQSLTELHSQLWAPLKATLEGSDKIILSPDGLLNLVPFAALIDQSGHPMIERYHLAYVSSGRTLVGRGLSSGRSGRDLLLVANPAFEQKRVIEKPVEEQIRLRDESIRGERRNVDRPVEEDKVFQEKTIEMASKQARVTGEVSLKKEAEQWRPTGSLETSLRSRDFVGSFPPLPGTERESREIPPLISATGGGTEILVGGRATEAAVKAVRSPKILHLATHGFFLADQSSELGLNSRGVKVTGFVSPTTATGFGNQTLAAPPAQMENPLVRSGLALSGANYAAEITEGEDGLLTALEVSAMDLYHTDLVVLSACETAVGTVETGEGVFGLRRAFALAGAQNLLMSLWAVNDDITAFQMKVFYQTLRTHPPADALREAQLQTIRYLKNNLDGIAPPALWAPFILQGAHAFGP